MDIDEHWMRHALMLAQRAAEQGEVPVGAVLVQAQEIIGQGWNQPITGQDPTAHAEVVALRAAANKMGNYRLAGTTLYVTLEPCVMCVGAIVHARVTRVVFGAADHKTGAVTSVFNLLQHPAHNHHAEYTGGVCADACTQILREFFEARRAHADHTSNMLDSTKK